jgi:hypothetical protein
MRDIRSSAASRGVRFATLWLTLVLLAALANAQVVPEAPDPAAADTLLQLRTALHERENDVVRLERMLQALNEVDSVYLAHCPSWVVLDEDLRQRVFKVFRNRGEDPGGDPEVLIITNPEQTQLLLLRAGEREMGRRDVQITLSDSLHAQLLTGDYAKRLRDAPPPPPRKAALFGSTPRYAALSVSAFGAALLFSNGLGAEVALGEEAIGYHFWSTGSVQILGRFRHLKLGILAPLTFGKARPELTQPLTVRPRKLTGTKGVTVFYDVPVGPQTIAAHLSVGDIRGVTNPELLAEGDPIYFLHTVAQLTYARAASWNGGEDQFTFTGGLGYHQIDAGAVQPDGRIVTEERMDFLSPILAVDYLSRGNRLYGATAQFYNSILFLKGWVELVPNFIFLDIKYYAPVFRPAKMWEQPYFFMISPRIQVVY